MAAGPAPMELPSNTVACSTLAWSMANVPRALAVPMTVAALRLRLIVPVSRSTIAVLLFK